MKNFSKTVVGLAFLSAATASNADYDVNVWNWSDYIGETTVADFEKATGLKTNYALFDSNEMVEARLLSGKSGFDAVMMTSYYVPRLAKAGALQKIDKSKIPNWKNLDPVRMEALAEIDPDNQYAYPYTEISVGIGYNKQKLAEIFGKDFKLDSWDVLFNPENSKKLKQCGIAIIDSPIEIISTAMHVLGKTPNSENASDYDEALKVLTSLAANVSYFHSSRYINDLASGEICVAVGYSGDVLQATERAKANKIDIEYVIPKEGSVFWFDCWTIAANADHYDAAHKWFNYLLDPKVATTVANDMRYMMPVTDAIKGLDDVLKANPSLNIPEEKMKTMYFLTPTSSKVTKITNKVWNSMKLNSGKVEDEEETSEGWD
ncbi:MAG: polyamine ABC transporter substrate-binding protein [Succinivibrio dextrinosolvens]|uniref:polyamine ABC transporter substrate-binding protein n=1 Tax=Succinivibrio sp. TaxID=2053619 RepID=UPI0025E7645D|nr:polyamine ABC transporter substrate-binding protein [Succinivibrio sp.]MBQ9221194.1 polyamine ABC transporter substrate-binding protein [Succinivibrio sp.]MDY6416536.1 polyamine ABC transporter substrate-binding protein [Succinivibrio dextrinosolvens]